MAVYLATNQSYYLLQEIVAAINRGEITTWSVDNDGDFTHTPPQWKHRAWFHPKVEPNRLAFYMICPLNSIISTEVYAIYHGRFLEMSLAHFDKIMTHAIATALPEGADSMGTRT